VLCKIHRLIFAATRFLARPVGFDNNFTMRDNHNAEDIIEVSPEDLDEDQKKLVEAHRDAFTKLCLDSFSKTRSKMIQKNQLLTPSITVTPIDPFAYMDTSRAASFQDTVDTVGHHVLINQYGVLVNTLANLIQQVASGRPSQQTGPAYFYR
jgi:hypothetical protein